MSTHVAFRASILSYLLPLNLDHILCKFGNNFYRQFRTCSKIYLPERSLTAVKQVFLKICPVYQNKNQFSKVLLALVL